MMAFLGTDPTVNFGRSYGFEERRLTYLAKLSALVDRPATFLPFFDDYILRDPDESVFGPPPWLPGGFLPAPDKMDLFPLLWEAASRKLALAGTFRYYAEKAPTWVAPYISRHIDPFNICLFRDPRDNFISALAFMRKRGNMVGFGREQNDSDETFARTTIFRWINFFEAWYMTRCNPRTVMVRYEDFAADPEPFAATLKARLDLNLDPAATENISRHRTAPSHGESISRYQAEPLPPALNAIFLESLGPEMALLGYGPVPPTRFPKVQFKDLSALANLSADGKLEPEPDRVTVEITGPDFFFNLPVEPFEAAAVRSLWISVCATVGDHCTVFWRREGEFFSEERAVYARYNPGGHWRVLKFDFTGHPRWTGTIAEIRLDLFNFAGPATPGYGQASWFRFIAA
jgi:hypothetical protein